MGLFVFLKSLKFHVQFCVAIEYDTHYATLTSAFISRLNTDIC